MNEFKIIHADDKGMICIRNLPRYWKMKIEKWECPYCGKNKLLKKSNEEYRDYVECIQCGRAFQ